MAEDPVVADARNRMPVVTVAFFLNARAYIHENRRVLDSPKVDMLVGMRRRGLRVVLCVPTVNGPPAGAAWPLPNELEVFALPFYGGYLNLIRRSPVLLLRALPGLVRASRDWDVMGGMAPGGFGLVMVAVGLVKRRKVFMYARGDIAASLPHELADEGPLTSRFIQLAFRPLELATRLLAARGVPIFSTGHELAQRFPGPNAIALENYARPDVVGSGPVSTVTDRLDRVLYVGRISREKGVDVLVNALGLLRGTGLNLRLVIAGDGPDRDLVDRLAAHLELTDAITFMGHVSEPETLRTVILACGIFVMPSLSEGVPMALLEAMALGRTVVASNVGGIPTVISDGIDGLLVPPSDPAALAMAIQRLVDDANLAANLSSHAQIRSQKLTPQAQADLILENLGVTYSSSAA